MYMTIRRRWHDKIKVSKLAISSNQSVSKRNNRGAVVTSGAHNGSIGESVRKHGEENKAAP